MLIGEKVRLRAVRRDDLARQAEWENDLKNRLLADDHPPSPVSLEQLEAQFNRSMGEDPKPGNQAWFAIEADGVHIGGGGLFSMDLTHRTCWLGINIGDPEYQGKRYGRDAIRVLLDYAFRYRNMRKVSLATGSDNGRALRCYQACGFVEEGRLRRQEWSGGDYRDTVHMGILRDEWEKAQSASVETPFPETIETPRLLLRAPRIEDSSETNAAIQETYDDLHRWMDWAAHRPTIEETEAYIRRARDNHANGTEYVLRGDIRDTGVMAVVVGLSVLRRNVPSYEIGYWCRAAWQRRGYVTEAVRAITDTALDRLGANRIEIHCDAENERSRRVAERSGYRLEAELRNEDRGTDGGLRTTRIYAVVPDDIAAPEEPVAGE